LLIIVEKIKNKEKGYQDKNSGKLLRELTELVEKHFCQNNQ
jgi:hypothetical protein